MFLTVSGVGRIFPWSKAMPRSMWMISPVWLSMRMLLVCLSPRPRMWPTMELVATDLV